MMFDVFVSFRGTDTGRTFVSHVFHSLLKKRIRVFKKEEETQGSEPASSQALWPIEVSRAAIVVISTNFASSALCLDQLAKIIECKEKRSLVVVPVFYEIHPSDVLTQADNLGDGDNLAEDPKLEMWRNALTKFTRKFHQFFDWKQEDSCLIDRIINYISHHLSPPQVESQETGRLRKSRVNPLSESASSSTHETESNELSLTERGTLVLQDLKAALGSISERCMYGKGKPITVKPRPESFLYVDKDVTGNELSDFSSLVGMDRHMKEVYPLLDLDSKNQVRRIGILGVGGVGKTTLARYVYEQIRPCFQDHYYYFLNDDTRYSPGCSSTCLLEEVTRLALTPTSQSPLSRNCEVVKAKLGHRKVLLIVDGLYLISQLKDVTMVALLFGPGSRLIVVTQDESLLVDCRLRHIYEVETLNHDEALELFSQFAFKQKHIPRGFFLLAVRAVLITGRIPLSLKVFGSFLCGKNTEEWEFELCRIEASQDNCIARVSSYIVNGCSQRRRPTKQEQCTEEDHKGEELPSYSFALG